MGRRLAQPQLRDPGFARKVCQMMRQPNYSAPDVGLSVEGIARGQVNTAARLSHQLTRPTSSTSALCGVLSCIIVWARGLPTVIRSNTRSARQCKTAKLLKHWLCLPRDKELR